MRGIKKEGKFNREIRIVGVSDKTNRELSSICDKIGVNKSAFLKTKISEIINSYPEDYRNYIAPED